MDNKQQTLRELALFAGAGGGILGGKLLGWECVCAVEFNAYARSVLLARQNDGILSPFPIWDDVRTFDGKPWRGLVDVVSGGFPCQDISVAGTGAGIDGDRSGLWSEFNRIIGEIRPHYAFIENSPMLVTRGLDRVLCDLAAMGYDAEWGVISAADCGAPHQRERMWIVAYSKELQRNGCKNNARGSMEGREVPELGDNCRAKDVAYTNSAQREGKQFPKRSEAKYSNACPPGWWATEPAVGRVANGMASRVDRLKAIGNGQVPIVAATAWAELTA